MSESGIQLAAGRDFGEDFADLVACHLAGELSAAQRERLNAELESQPRRRDEFVAMCLEAHLFAACVDPESTGDDCLADMADDDSPLGPQTQTNAPPTSASWSCLSPAIDGRIGYFPEWPVAYLVALVVLGVGALIAAFTYVSHPAQVAVRASRGIPQPAATEHRPEFVGRVTGLVDCRFSDQSMVAFAGSHVPLGRRYALVAGLLEITYDSGAKVILQGPCAYEVESAAGGFLSLGKLTARVEQKTAASGQQPVASEKSKIASVTIPNPQSPNPQSPNPQSPNPQIPKSPNPLFSVRTPSAIVTDLGTEFGIDVPKQGGTTLHVFAGKVQYELLAADNSGTVSQSHLVAAGQSARIEGDCVVVVNETTPKTYVRSLSKISRAGAASEKSTIAYWRFEEDVPSAKGLKQNDFQLDAVRDWSGHGNHLDYWPCNGQDGIGDYIASDDVPPKAMFKAGCDGGKRSFNSGALDPTKTGRLISDYGRHGSPFDICHDLTVEGFFKTDGDQSAADKMGVVYFHGSETSACLIHMNHPTPGAVELCIFGSTGDRTNASIAVSVADHNYADGRWHYFAARHAINRQTGGGSISLLLGDETGANTSKTAAIPASFHINPSNGNLYVGRCLLQPKVLPSRQFRGLIDEIRVCRGMLTDGQLLFALKPHPSEEMRRATENK